MLLRLAITNFQSILARQEFSLVASSLRDEGVDLLASPAVKHKILPVALVFGANASGKSSVLGAIQIMCDHIKRSQANFSPGAEIPRRPFLLDDEAKRKPSQFDCDFIVGGVRYHYGYEYNDEEFIEEWLYAIGTSGKQTWFHRERGEFRFGKHLRGQNKTIAGLVRKNSLFLSAAAQNAHSQLTPLYEFFARHFHFKMDTNPDHHILSHSYRAGLDRRILDFLKAADAGIVDVDIKTLQPDDQMKLMAKDFVELMRRHIDELPPEVEELPELAELRFGHLGTGEAPVFLGLSRESRGTLRLLELLGPAIRALDSGSILVLDELDASLHTLLAAEILKLFSNSHTNPKGAQLIASTHDTNLMRSGYLRRDQVWFTEKDRAGATRLYPLTDIQTRKTDNIEKGYLQGRFGGVPFLGDLDSLVLQGEQS